MRTTETFVKVWDPLVRFGHWILVVAFFTAYFTEDEFLAQHVWAGYIAFAVLCVRLVWGFIGTEHARFSDFVRSPANIVRYIKGLKSHRSGRYLGHNPAGGAMILALLLGVAGTAFSGMMVHAYENHAGPLAAWVGDEGGKAAASHRKHRDDDEGAEHFWEETHEVLANLTLLLVGLHVAGGLMSSVLYRENLIKAMFTGKKPAMTVER